MGKIIIAEVLRLRATSAVSRDQSVRRSAQDDDSLGEPEEKAAGPLHYATPDFLSSLVALANFMRLSLRKAAYVAVVGCRDVGNPGPLRSG